MIQEAETPPFGLLWCLEVFRVEAVLFHEVVYHCAGDADPRGNPHGDFRELVRPVPSCVLDLSGFGYQFAARVIRGKADHERVREGPRLATEVPDVPDLDPDFFAHLAADGLLYGFAGLDEAGEYTVKPGRKPWRAGQQDLLPVPDEYDGSRTEARVMHHPAPRTPLRKLPRRRLRFSAAASAEPMRRVPADDLLRPARHPEEILIH